MTGPVAICSVIWLVWRLIEVPFDDALFFRRIAVNWLEGYGFSWNRSEGPVFGSTSQLFQFLAVPTVGIFGEYWVLATKVSSAFFLLAAFVFLCRSIPGLDPVRRTTHAWIAVSLSSPAIVWTIHSCMETAMTLFCLSAFLYALCRTRDTSTPARPWTVPLLGAICYLARPDTLLLCGGVLLLTDWNTGSTWLRTLRRSVVLAGAIGIIVAAEWLYYGTPVPLSFFVKSSSLSPYGSEFLSKSIPISRSFAAYVWGFLLPSGVLILGRPTRHALALFLPALAFSAYHLFMTVPVMGSYGRFHAPVIPFVALAATDGLLRSGPKLRVAAGLAGCAGGIALLSSDVLGRAPWNDAEWVAWVAGFVVSSALVLSRALEGPRWAVVTVVLFVGMIAGQVPLLLRGDEGTWTTALDDATYVARSARASKFRGVEKLRRCLGDDITLFHSEIGVPGYVFPASTIVDTAGLMNAQTAVARRSIDQQCLDLQPEAIFLPHVFYKKLNREIRSGACIEQYERVVRSPCSLYVRRDLAATFRGCR